MTRKWKHLAVVAAGTVVLDQATKLAVTRYFEGQEGSTLEIIPGWFDLILTHNPGAAWGFLGGIEPDWLRILVFVLISIGASAMVLWLAHKAKPGQWAIVWSAGLVLGGAVGNLIDRVRIGHVIDFLDVYTHAPWFSFVRGLVGMDPCHPAWGCHWPAFNIADMAIVIGVGLLATDGMFTRKPKPAQDVVGGQGT